MQRGKKLPSAVAKIGIAVRFFLLVQFGQNGGAVGAIYTCSQNSKKLGGIESIIKTMVQWRKREGISVWMM